MSKIKTKFASPERSTSSEIKRSGEEILQKKLFIETINALPEIVMFLDKNRQVVFCNDALLKTLKMSSPEQLLGKRPGEVFNCVNADKEEGGCGTSKFCAECGAVKSILASQEGDKSIEECRLTMRTESGEDSLDLRVWSIPIDIGEDRFTIFTLKNIEDEKRRELLERTFFHDILNETAVIMGYSQNMQDGAAELNEKTVSRINYIANRMADIIQGQRELLHAESGELELSESEFPVFEFLSWVVESFIGSKWAKDKEILVDIPDKGDKVRTDKTLLRRVMVNLTKNALEASVAGDKVCVGYKKEGEKITFYVKNPAMMPEDVQLQVFQRSFSTKGQGRGTGTYSVKLFVEKYLKGKVAFVSEEKKGTTFFVEFPV